MFPTGTRESPWNRRPRLLAAAALFCCRRGFSMSRRSTRLPSCHSVFVLCLDRRFASRAAMPLLGGRTRGRVSLVGCLRRLFLFLFFLRHFLDPRELTQDFFAF